MADVSFPALRMKGMILNEWKKGMCYVKKNQGTCSYTNKVMFAYIPLDLRSVIMMWQQCNKKTPDKKL